MSDDAVADQIFAIGSEIRYVAFGTGQNVVIRERSGLIDASSNESDRYEELLVNPTSCCSRASGATSIVVVCTIWSWPTGTSGSW
jgi:hypothetical protein